MPTSSTPLSLLPHQSLPLEVWCEIVSYLPHILETHARWCLTSKHIRAISESEPLWRARLLLFIHLWEHRQRSQRLIPGPVGAAAAAIGDRNVAGVVEAATADQHQMQYEVIMSESQRGREEGGRSSSSSSVVGLPRAPWRYWCWKQCVVHFVFSTVRTACVICGVSLGPANVPFSLLSAARTGPLASLTRRTATLNAPATPEFVPAPATAATLLNFPFEGCSVCSICLRRYFLLRTSAEVRSNPAIEKRCRFFSMHRGWIVCLRQEDGDRSPRSLGGRHEQSCLGEDVVSGFCCCDGAPAAPSRNELAESHHRPPPSRRGIRLRSSHDAHERSVTDGREAEQTASAGAGVEAVGPSSHALADRMLFIARRLQALGEKYPSAYHRSYSAVPLDPMHFFSWEGHFIVEE